MAIPPCGRFEYTALVPDNLASRWQMREQSGSALSSEQRHWELIRAGQGDDRLTGDRLVGLEPSLEIVEAGLTPEVRVSPYTGTVRPVVLLSRLVLRASQKERASVAAFSFCVDQSLTRSWMAGDVLQIVRTGCGGLGLSVVRGGRLVTAIGAVTEVPLGEQVKVRIPRAAVEEAEHVFSRLDPSFGFSELPIEIQVESERRVRNRGRLRIGGYQVFVEHGFYPGVPGISECAAISHVGSCPETAAICSALLLEHSDLSELVKW